MKIQSANAIQSEAVQAEFARVKARVTPPVDAEKTRTIAGPGKSLAQEKTVAADTARRIDKEELQKALKELNDHMGSMDRSIQFSIDDSSRDVIVKIVDKNSGEVISQIPPQEVLELRERMREMAGLIIEKTV